MEINGSFKMYKFTNKRTRVKKGSSIADESIIISIKGST